jgi:hypothetical protein
MISKDGRSDRGSWRRYQPFSPSSSE